MDEGKQRVRQVFESVATVYDSPATRFFPFCADRLLAFVRPVPGTRVLDIATGTGAVAVPFAQAIEPSGRVTAIDLSAAMLDKAEVNLRKMALANIDLHEMDAEHLEFRSGYFHTVVCSYGLFFMPDMSAALREWVRVLRPGGTLAFTCFETTAFQPMLDDFIERMKAFGVQLPDEAVSSYRIRSTDHCSELLDQAGLEQVRVEGVQLGYHLGDEHEWWEVVTNTAMRALLEMVPAAQRDDFRRQHLAFVAGLQGIDGIWMDVQTRFSRGVKPAN